MNVWRSEGCRKRLEISERIVSMDGEGPGSGSGPAGDVEQFVSLITCICAICAICGVIYDSETPRGSLDHILNCRNFISNCDCKLSW